jgi:signal transduction histidine kinase
MPRAPRRLRIVFLVAILLMTLLLVVFLAAQAIMTARYHQTTAEGVLRDYARLAASQYAGRASQDLYYDLINPVIQRLSRLPAGPLAPMDIDSVEGEAVFQFAGSGEVELVGPDSLSDWRRWIRDTVLVHSKTLSPSAPFSGIVKESSGRSYFLAFIPATGATPVRGFLVPFHSLRPILRRAAERAPLLPASLTDGVALDSLVSVTVTSRRGTVLFQSADFPSTFIGLDSTGDYVGRLPVTAALQPDIAESLIIGGLPRSRLPLLLGLLALTVALIAAALLLLRREQELGRLRAEFVSGVSHELRTPLAQIRMFAETLRLGRVRTEAERIRSLSIVDQEARRLTHLVENLLYFSRSERQPQRITAASAPLQPLVREVVEGFAPLAANRDMTIQLESSTNSIARIDPDAVRQILLNLLDNAVKYGPAGQVIRVRVGARNGRASVEVEDEGPGIPEQDRAKIWDRFWRLERDRESNVAGTGIGLAIVRELAELHGGHTLVEVTSGGGTIFVATLGELSHSENGS